ncbi:MAG: hypothetical protein U0795_21855 [Pirellulales bacterium]
MATQNGTSGLLMACWRMGQAVSLTIVMMSSVLMTSGCALCDSPYDYDFAAFGGVRERYDRQHGRVGSILDPADAAGGTKTVAVERSFVPASGFRAPGEDFAASEYEPEPESELPTPSTGEGGTGSSGSAAEGELGPPSEPTPDLPPPATPAVPAEPDVPAAEPPGELNLDELFPSSAQ